MAFINNFSDMKLIPDVHTLSNNKLKPSATFDGGND